jgi:hypothetical protein
MATLATGKKVTTSTTGIATAAEFALTLNAVQVRIQASTDTYVRAFAGNTSAAALAAAAAGSAIASTVALARANEYMFIPAGATKTIARSAQPVYWGISVISAAASVVSVESTDWVGGN